MNPYTDTNESKHHVLSHYLDELLPSDSHSEESSQSAPDAVAVESAEEGAQNESDKDTIAPANLANDSDLSANSAIKALKDTPNSIIHTPSETKIITTEVPATISTAVTQDHRAPESTPLTALNEDKKPHGTSRDSKAYEAHKQRLEKMLQQLTPVPSLEGIAAKPQNDKTSNVSTPEATHSEIATQDIPTILNEGADESVIALNADVSLTDIQPLSSEWLTNGRPHWAQEPFDILLIDVNGLKLAVPLVALGHIETIEGDLTPLFGQSEWFLGLQKTAFGNIKTVDTAQYVMPEKSSREDGHRYKFVVSISGMDWGLAVDEIDQPTLIDPDNIRWRAKRSNRPWMAGTVKDHMCVLLDIPAMGKILLKEDQNHCNHTGE